ncbi:hypothetical protein LDH92_04915 [Bifidobacterium animalis subsp. lactis]|uniref:hypothetical protein n=1 Tax=Bifidobacterium animalis TaxID=28025 RepID=UPI001CE181BA|nr:hypothetical protein [Bifidobacterium animalis]UBZ00898.1 hypothetical protein LDH92_04915 [Bifidobacterium animalis subsp. lactis]
MTGPSILPDDPSLCIPPMESDDENELNSQTAHNRAMVEYSARCGCFHCGGIFAGNEVAQWLQEDDGEDTALCPYCGVDAVIVGNEQYPVCMMVLSKLYMHWFGKEYRQRLEAATDMPTCGSHGDYLRKGLPFLTNHDRKITVVGEIELFPLSVYDRAEELCNESHPPRPVEYDDVDVYMGGVVTVHAGFDEHGYYYCDFITGSGVKLPYDAWNDVQQDLVLNLSRQYGDALRGIITDSLMHHMRLFIDADVAE